jgi:hypothetical protein
VTQSSNQVSFAAQTKQSNMRLLCQLFREGHHRPRYTSSTTCTVVGRREEEVARSSECEARKMKTLIVTYKQLMPRASDRPGRHGTSAAITIDQTMLSNRTLNSISEHCIWPILFRCANCSFLVISLSTHGIQELCFVYCSLHVSLICALSFTSPLCVFEQKFACTIAPSAACG